MRSRVKDAFLKHLTFWLTTVSLYQSQQQQDLRIITKFKNYSSTNTQNYHSTNKQKYQSTNTQKYQSTNTQKHKMQLTCSPVFAMFLTGVPALLIIIQKPVCLVVIVITFNTFIIFNIVFIVIIVVGSS